MLHFVPHTDEDIDGVMRHTNAYNFEDRTTEEQLGMLAIVQLRVLEWTARLVIKEVIPSTTEEKIEALRATHDPINVEYCLKPLSYPEYLQSEHWQFVRTIALEIAGNHCQLCGSSYCLNVHHRTYEHKGEEYNAMGDLIVLCQNCHAKFHDKLPKDGEPNR